MRATTQLLPRSRASACRAARRRAQGARRGSMAGAPEVAAEVIRRLVPVGVECFLAQLLDVGFFHGDPHRATMVDGDLPRPDRPGLAEIDRFDSRARRMAT